MSAVLICRHCGFATTCRSLGARCPTDSGLLLPRQTLGESERDPSVGRVLAGRFLVLGGQVRHEAVTIYRGVDLATGQRVSVKTVPPYAVGAEDRIARLTAESRLLRRLSHATLPAFVAGGRTNDGLVWVVYGGMRGVSLRALLNERGRLPPNRAINIALRILAALDRLHALGRVHSDLRPENILVTPRGLRGNDEIRLLDLGSATARGFARPLDAHDGGRGYRAPEQLGGEPVQVTTDVHAVGVLLHEMLAGRAPFGDTAPFETVKRGERPPPKLALEGEFVTLAGVVERALQADPHRRWQRARAMAIALKAAFVTRDGERPVQSSAPPPVAAVESGPLPRAPMPSQPSSPRRKAVNAFLGLAAFG